LRLQEIIVRPVCVHEESFFQEYMESQHYLGSLPKIGNTFWYVALFEGEWVALLSFSAAALKCAVRDAWIGWSFRHQYDRLNLIANNSRFLILPNFHHKNLASRVLSLIHRRIQDDWRKLLAIRFYCWRPLLIRPVIKAQSTRRQTGNFLALPRGINVSVRVTAPHGIFPKKCLSFLFNAIRADFYLFLC